MHIVSNVEGETKPGMTAIVAVSYTHIRAHETKADPVCRALLDKYIALSIVTYNN